MSPKPHAATARRAHLALQARRDALAKIRAGETVDLRLARDARGVEVAGGALVTARALESHEDPVQKIVLVIINRRLRAERCVDRAGLRVGPRIIQRKHVLGVVIAVNGRAV